MIAGTDVGDCCAWFAARREAWRDGIRWATLDLSSSYRVVFDTMLPDATQVADPCHVVALANHALDECRRRVQKETVGHRGRKNDPLYRARRRLVMAKERLSVDGHERLMGPLRAGDPTREVWFAWNAKEVVRQIYDHHDVELAIEWVDEIVRDLPTTRCRSSSAASAARSSAGAHRSSPRHRAHVSNGPTEAINDLVKRVKRTAFNFKRFDHYRLRALLYACRPNWSLLDQMTP